MGNACQGTVNRHESRWFKITKAVFFASGVYSLLFLVYISFRLTFNPSLVHLNDLVIDYVPFFTFLRSGILMVGVCLASIILYVIMWSYSRSKRAAKAKGELQRSQQCQAVGPDGIEVGNTPYGQPRSERFGVLGILVLVAWFLSTAVWAYSCFLVLSYPKSYWTVYHAPGVLGWHVAIFMFLVSYISTIILYYEISHHVNVLNTD